VKIQHNAVSMIASVRGNSKAVRPNQVTVGNRPRFTHESVRAHTVSPLRGSIAVEARSTRPTSNTNAKPGTGNLPVEQRDKTLTKKPVSGVALPQRQNRQPGSSDTLRHPATDAQRSSGQSKQSSAITEVHKKVPTAATREESLAASSRKPEQAVKTSTGATVPPRTAAADNTARVLASKATGDKKQISTRKRAANRKNAKKSTGPKSQRWKNTSRLNSFKHGMTARQLLVRNGPSAENPKDFNALRRRHHRACSPVGERERMLVEEIAWCEWLYRRSLRCENGFIERNTSIELAGDSSELQALKAVLGRQQKDELSQQLRTMTDHLALPLGPGLDQILRYRRTTLHQRDRAIVDLERLQRIRKGDPSTGAVESSVLR
jgi:hypothetical protein